MKIDKKIIKELTDYLNEFNLTEIEYTEKDTKIKVSKSSLPKLEQNQIISSNTKKITENKNEPKSGPKLPRQRSATKMKAKERKERRRQCGPPLFFSFL